MARGLSLNGWNRFKTKEPKVEFKHDLIGLNQAILVIVVLSVKVCLNCAFTLEQVIVSILVKLITQLYFYFVLATSHHRRGILNVQRVVGYNIRRHTDE
jgi:hypothetical protein